MSNRDHFPVETDCAVGAPPAAVAAAEAEARIDSVKTHFAEVLEIDRLRIVVQCRRGEQDGDGAEQRGEREHPQEVAVEYHRYKSPVVLLLCDNKKRVTDLLCIPFACETAPFEWGA